MSRLFLRLFEFKVSTLGYAVTLFKGTSKNRGWCIQDTVEIQQNDLKQLIKFTTSKIQFLPCANSRMHQLN